MDTVYKRLFSRGEALKIGVYRVGVKLSKKWVKPVGFTRELWALALLSCGDVYEYTRFTTPSTHKLYTFFTQAGDRVGRRKLCIETLPNGIYLFTNHVIKLDGFFNLLN